MKKLGIVSSIIIITVVFIYTMSFVSSQNTCTGVRVYECTALEKQKADTAKLVQQQLDAQLAQQKATEWARQQAINSQVAQQQTTQQQTAASVKQAADKLAAQQAAARAKQAADQLAVQQAAVQAQAAASVNTRTRAS